MTNIDNRGYVKRGIAGLLGVLLTGAGTRSARKYLPLVWVAVAVAGLPVNVIAADKKVHAVSPGYDIVVGRDVTFSWYETAKWRDQHYAVLYANNRVKRIDPTDPDLTTEYVNGKTIYSYTWQKFPFGDGWWQVAVYAKNSKIGKTSIQNFYHYINMPDIRIPKPAAFEYKKGAKDLGQSRDLTIFYELTKDYSIDIASYFKALDKLPDPIKWDDQYDKTIDKMKDMYNYIMGPDDEDANTGNKGFNDIDTDFIDLDKGVLTLKKGYRWDGTSNPFVWEEEPTDLRSSCIHDALYDLMRMDHLEWDDKRHGRWIWNDPGYMNRLIADSMHFMIAVEDKDKPVDKAWSDWRTLRKMGRKNTDKEKLLRAFKYHVTDLTAWASADGAIDLHWTPANLADDDPKDYHTFPHYYDIYRTTSNSSTWSHIGSRTFYLHEMATHTDASIYFTDQNVNDGEIYYYWIRVNDPDSDGDGWTDQEEIFYGKGHIHDPDEHPEYNKKHYDESNVEAAVLTYGVGKALQLNGTTNYVAADSVATNLDGDALTMEAWVYPEPQTGKSAVLSFNTATGSNFNLLMYDGDTGKFCSHDNYNMYTCSKDNFVAGNWYHVALAIDENDSGILWVNGTQQATFNTKTMPNKTALFSIGQEWDGIWTSQHFLGKVDEVRIWNYARSLTEEIIPGMCKPMRGYHQGMAGLWNFDEPSLSRRAFDTTVYSNDGTLVGYDKGEESFVPSGAMHILTLGRNITVELDAGGYGAIPTGRVSTGVCGTLSPTVTPSSFTCQDAGPKTVTLTVESMTGHKTTADAVITIADKVPPTVMTQDITVVPDASGKVSISADQVNAGSADACGIDSIAVAPSSFTCQDAGPNSVTLTVNDIHGNVSTAEATVMVAECTVADKQDGDAADVGNGGGDADADSAAGGNTGDGDGEGEGEAEDDATGDGARANASDTDIGTVSDGGGGAVSWLFYCLLLPILVNQLARNRRITTSGIAGGV